MSDMMPLFISKCIKGMIGSTPNFSRHFIYIYTPVFLKPGVATHLCVAKILQGVAKNIIMHFLSN
jgi:hypothetical protein